MEPGLTTINVEPRIEIYGPLPTEVFFGIVKAIAAEYPSATIQSGDCTINRLATITIGKRKQPVARKDA